MPNGKSGASGPNAVPLVARDQNPEPGHAVKRSSEAMTSVLGNLRRLGSARHPSVQVALPAKEDM